MNRVPCVSRCWGLRGIFFWVLLGILFFIPAAGSGEEADSSLKLFDPLPGWHIYGDNTLRFDYFDISGKKAASPFQFDDEQVYNQFNINLEKRGSPYDSWRGQIYGVYNRSDYRSTDDDLVPERLHLSRIKGDSAIPYHVEVGDYLAYFSHRTIQSSLKGVQLELQPRSSGKIYQSIQLFTGAAQPSWPRFQLQDNYNNGLSYLLNSPSVGSLSLNFLHNFRQADPSAGKLDRQQFVFSLAGDRQWRIGNQRIITALELDRLTGDHNGIATAADGQNKNANAIFFQLRGQSQSPLTYRVRFERYDQDYRPMRALVPPDRRSVEGHVGWRFLSGQNLRFRVQNFIDGLESSNPTETNIAGVSIAGPVLKKLLRNLSGNLKLYVQDVEDDSLTTDRTTTTFKVDLAKPLWAGWSGRLGYFWVITDNRTPRSSNVETRQWNLSLNHALSFWGVRGTLSPGMMIREVDNPVLGRREFFPTLSATLIRGRHQLALNAGLNAQNRHENNSLNPDIETLNATVDYRYRLKKDTLGVELTAIDRQSFPGGETVSYDIGFFWTHYFDKPVRAVSRARKARAGGGTESALARTRGRIDLAELIPGSALKKVRTRLKKAGIGPAVEQGDFLIYETSLFDSLDQRQRLVLKTKRNRLAKAALIIDFDDPQDGSKMMRNFNHALEVLMNKYGKPDNYLERGRLSASLREDIQDEKLIRIYEWILQGGILRFGVPRRLDGKIYMELHFAPTFSRPQDTLWSMKTGI